MMRPVSASLVAMAGAYAVAAAYWAVMSVVGRAPREHRALALYCLSLAVFSVATACTWEARDPAAAATAQLLQIIPFMAAMAFFTEHALRIVAAPPRGYRIQRGLAILGGCAAAAGLFFDPAHPDVGGARPLASLTPAGLLLLAPMAALCLHALSHLYRAARRDRELVAPALLCTLTFAGGMLDLINRGLGLNTSYVFGAHGAAFSLIGFTYLAVGRITRVDAALAEQKELLAASYHQMRSTQEELVKKEQLAAVGELSAVIAHEVRNPLAIIKNAMGGLRKGTLEPEDAETLLSILDEETDRLNRLVDDLLAYARPIAAHPGPVDLRALVARAVELAAGGHPDIERVEVELDLSDVDGAVEGDEALLRHALINIVDNALQAMPDGGTLTVTMAAVAIDDRPHVAVRFHDTGEGMDTQVRSRARDPFFTTRQSGTGLGLAIVERVARAHGGTVELESRHGQGTTVTFSLPRERGSLAPPQS